MKCHRLTKHKTTLRERRRKLAIACSAWRKFSKASMQFKIWKRRHSQKEQTANT